MPLPPSLLMMLIFIKEKVSEYDQQKEADYEIHFFKNGHELVVVITINNSQIY